MTTSKGDKAASSAVARLTSAVRRDETILRLGGDGGGYSMTWAADDRQLVTVFDGAGWPEYPNDHHFCTRVFAIGGGPQAAIFRSVPGYPDISLFDFLRGSATPYYGTSALAVDGRIYQYLATMDHRYPFADKRIDRLGLLLRGGTWTGLHFNGCKIIYSPDGGRIWCNQDGSAPVVRESPHDLSRKTLVFHKEPQDAFSLLTFLQMGKDYRDNTDGYVYVYAPNGSPDGPINELVMFRVLKDRILDRGAYEFFEALQADGNASWTTDIHMRGVVHTFPGDWTTNPWLPIGWLPSVVYNAPLGVYMMVNCASGRGAAEDLGQVAASGPSYLGLWVAPNPWGPWRQIHEETAWTPAGDPVARADGAQIAPKWIADDGLSFWLTWWDSQTTSGFRQTVTDARMRAVQEQNRDDYKRLRFQWRQYHPYFALNTQRIDLVMT